MTERLEPFQVEGASFLAKRKSGLLADEMGLGKTPQAICASDMVAADSILVLGPAVARANWGREFYKFQIIPRGSRLVETRVGTYGPQVTICSYDLVRDEDVFKRLMSRRYDVLIGDEIQFLKNRKAKQTKRVYGKGCDGSDGLISQADHYWGLSGTPAPNNYAELWPIMRAAMGEKADYWTFVNRYCEGYDGKHGYVITGNKRADELKRKLEPYMLRRKTVDVMPNMPPIRFVDFTLDKEDIDPAFAESAIPIEELDLIRRTLDEGKELSAIEDHISKFRYISGMAKVLPVAKYVRNELKSGLDKIVLFAHHRHVIEWLREELKEFGAATLYGKTDSRKKQLRIDRFQHDPRYRVFIGQLRAAGTNITLTAAARAMIVEASPVPGDNWQVAKRCHRYGQTRPVLIQFPHLEGTTDALIQMIARRKTADLAALFD